MVRSGTAVYIRLTSSKFRWNLASLDKPGDLKNKASQTTDDTFLLSADLGRTKVSSLDPQRKVEEPVAPFKRGIARKFKLRTGFDGVNRRRLREQKARRVIGPVMEEPKRRGAEPDASPTAEAPSVRQGEEQNTTATTSAEEVVEGPPSFNTSSATLETALVTPETTLASLETALATPDTTLATSYTAPSTPGTTAYKSQYLGLSLKPLWKSESSEETKTPSESRSVVCEPEDGDDSDEHKNEYEDNAGSKEGNKEKEEEFEGESEESEGLEEGKEGEGIEESEEGQEVEQAEENEEVRESEEENDRAVDSGAPGSNQVSAFEGEYSVSVPHEEPSNLPTGRSVPALVDMPASTDAPAAATEAPAVMEAAQTVKQGQVVELEEAPVTNEKSTNVTDGEQATPAPTMDTSRPTSNAPLSTNTGRSSAYTLRYLMETLRQLVKTPGLAGFSSSPLPSQSPSSKLDRSSPTSGASTQANTSAHVSSATTNDVSIALAPCEDTLRGPKLTNKLIIKTRVKSNNSPMRVPKVVEEARVVHGENNGKKAEVPDSAEGDEEGGCAGCRVQKIKELPRRKTRAARSHRTDAPSSSMVSPPTPMVLATPSTLLPYSRPSGSSSSTLAPSSASYAPGVMTPKTWQPRWAEYYARYR
ncbi:hypothetical protein FRC07_002059 [Ceratobasidium sp. 392]|nr:hypothetical protein FRC07_002059 [Ceratobasidium sp. 392]